MESARIIDSIRQVAAKVLPKGSTLYLYGSRARGDAHEDSDWDLLLLLDKQKIEQDDFNKYSYPIMVKAYSQRGMYRLQVTPSRFSGFPKELIECVPQKVSLSH